MDDPVARHSIDAGLHLMDRQIVDKDGKLAGKVDDLELTFPEGDDGPPFVTAILCGPGALPGQFGGRLGKWVESLHVRLHPEQRPDPGRVSRRFPSSRSDARRPVDAISYLKRDHRTVEARFKEFERTGRKAKSAKKKVVKRIVQELSLHGDVEEQIFSPALQDMAREKELMLVALEEHDVVKGLLQQPESMDPKEERFDAKVTEKLGQRLEEGTAAIKSPKEYIRLK